MANYPLSLITAYKAGLITRKQFVKSFGENQHKDFTVRGYKNADGLFITYRKHTAKVLNIGGTAFLSWIDGAQTYTADTIKEFICHIDLIEARGWKQQH